MTSILLIGEAYGEAEARLNAPFVGASGIELLRQLNEARIITFTTADRQHLNNYYKWADPKETLKIWNAHPEIHRTNVFNLRPTDNDLKHLCGPKTTGIPNYGPLTQSRHLRLEFLPELERLQTEILTHNPNVIVCLGNTALWALTGSTGITKRRGTVVLSTHLVEGFKLIPTYHPAAVLRQYENRPTVISDLMKAANECTTQEIHKPRREIWIEPSLEDIRRFFHTMGRGLLSVDIETSGQRVTSIAFAPNPQLALVIPFDDPRRKHRSYWGTGADEAECWRLIMEVLADTRTPKLFQNGLFDITFNWRSMHVRTFGAQEDTMLLSHALHPEAIKGLGYLGSIYTDEVAWKHLRPKSTIKRGN